MERATQGEIEHALGHLRGVSVRRIMDDLADHGMRVERIGADACEASDEDDAAEAHEPTVVAGTL